MYWVVLMEIRALIVDALNSAERARSISPPKSVIEISALRWELYASLQNLLDALAMIVSDLRLRRPSSYADLGVVLYDAGLIDEETRENIKLIAVTRNILAHAYRRLGSEDLDRIVKDILSKVEDVAKNVEKLVSEKNIDPEPIPLTNIERIAKVFEKNNVILAYLYGSRARGTEREDSDYDIAVLFGKADVSVVDEIRLAMEIARELGVSSDKIDIVALDKADPLLKMRILREGVPIYERPQGFRTRWEREEYLEILRQMDLYEIYIGSRPRSTEQRKNRELEDH